MRRRPTRPTSTTEPFRRDHGCCDGSSARRRLAQPDRTRAATSDGSTGRSPRRRASRPRRPSARTEHTDRGSTGRTRSSCSTRNTVLRCLFTRHEHGMTAPPAAWPPAALADADPRDLRSLQLRFADVGSHPKAVPSVVVTTYFHVPDLGAFGALPGVDPDVCWQFAVRPEEMHRIVASLTVLAPTAEPAVAISLSLRASRVGDLDALLPLDRPAAADAVRAAADALDPDSGLGRDLFGAFAAQARLDLPS